MGALLCPCSRLVNRVRTGDMDEQDEATQKMLNDDALSKSKLNKGSKSPYGTMNDDQVTFTSLNTSNIHKPVQRRNHERSDLQTQFNKVSGIEDHSDSDISIENQNKSQSNLSNQSNSNIKTPTQSESSLSNISQISLDSKDPNIIINDKDSNKKKQTNSKNKEETKDNEPMFLPKSSETLVVRNAGYDVVNGEYRWFLHAQKWCLFREDGKSFAIDGSIDASRVYTQLQQLQSTNAHFKWNQDIDCCWVITDMDGEHVYYGAPQQYHDKIPSNFDWISVHGSDPVPLLSQNKMHDSESPDDEEDSLTFGSLSSLRGNRRRLSNKSKIEPLIEETTNEDNEDLKDESNSNIKTKQLSVQDSSDGDNEEESVSELEREPLNTNNNDNDSNEDDDDQSDVSEMSD